MVTQCGSHHAVHGLHMIELMEGLRCPNRRQFTATLSASALVQLKENPEVVDKGRAEPKG